MKNYKVRALFGFNDTAEKTATGGDTPRKIGDIWNCTKERYEFLKDHKAVELVGIDKIEEATIKYSEEPKEPKAVFVGYNQVLENNKKAKSKKSKLTKKK